MRRALLVVALLPAVAAAQVSNLDDPQRLRAIAVPNATVAGAEEPATLPLNPAGPGFVAAPSIQYFHEGATSGEARPADALFLTAPLGGLVPSFALDWMRPGDTPRFRRTTFGLALSDHRTLSIGGSWTWYHSPDRELERVESLGGGLTIRPARWLSVAASATDMNARIAGVHVPVRYAAGAAVRTWRDHLTLSADLLANDQGDFTAKALAFGANVELVAGIALTGQLQAPLTSDRETLGLFAVTWNAPHSGITSGWSQAPGPDGRWFLGARTSAEAYRSKPHAQDAAGVDLREALSPPRSLLFGGERDPYGKLLERLGAVRDDPSVRALVLAIDDVDLGLARTGEVRRVVAEIAAKKRVVAYFRTGRLAEYWLATAATEIYAPPAAELEITGVASSTPFLRDGLAKVGLAFDVIAAGRYKNAPDPLVRGDMSEAQREATASLLDDLFARVVRDVAAGRRLDEDRVRALVARGLFDAREATEAKLLDGVAWPDELDRLTGGGKPVRVDAGWHPERRREAERWGPRPVVAVVPIEGAIVQGDGGGSPLGGPFAGAKSVADRIRTAAEDGGVKAIVLRVDSPGGDALASDLLWRAVAEARRKKPVVASFGDLAASGGYLAAVGADEIVAEPSTLTGSIGVFLVKPDASGLLGKLGVNVVTLKRGEHADLRSVSRPWTPEERTLLERHVRSFYDGFKARVVEGRKLSPEDVERVAGGRIWTGAQAKERGLVDRLGTLEDAIRLAKGRAGLAPDEPVDIRRYEPRRRLFEGLARFAAGDDPGTLERLAGAFPELRAWTVLLEAGPLVALPEDWLGP